VDGCGGQLQARPVGSHDKGDSLDAYFPGVTMSLTTLLHNALSELHYPLDENELRAMKNPIGMMFGHVRRKGAHRIAHQGWDLAAPEGSSIYALTRGELIWTHRWTGAEEDKYGNQILASFTYRKKTYFAFYAHLSDFNELRKGSNQLERGQELGWTGTTGNADIDSPHLHFEVRTTSAQLHKGLGGRLDPGEFFPELPKLPRQKACFI